MTKGSDVFPRSAATRSGGERFGYTEDMYDTEDEDDNDNDDDDDNGDGDDEGRD